MPAVKNAKHEAYCHAVVKGEAGSRAYMRIVAKKGTKQTSAEAGSAQLQQKPAVKARLAELRAKIAAKAEAETFLTIKEKRNFCASVVRAKGALLDVEGADAHLIQGLSYSKEGARIYAMPDKLAAIKLDNDLAVDGAEAGANKAIEIIIRKL